MLWSNNYEIFYNFPHQPKDPHIAQGEFEDQIFSNNMAYCPHSIWKPIKVVILMGTLRVLSIPIYVNFNIVSRNVVRFLAFK